MQKLKRFKLPVIILVLAASIGWAFKPNNRENLFEIAKNIEIFTSMYRELNLWYVDETQPGDLMRTAIDAMLNSLDPYTVYISEAQIEDYRIMTNRVYGGIGATIREVDGAMYITEPYAGFPANKENLKAGDKIIAVDDEPVEGKSTDEISERLKGQAGTQVKLTIQPLGSDETRDVKLERENIKMKDVSYHEMINDTVGYVKLDAFTQTAASEVRTALEDFKAKEAKGVILDLRGNGGGLMREAIAIVNMFVPKGSLVVTTKSRIEEQNQKHYAVSEPIDTLIPLTVLVDNMSASASEIVSGALQDLDRAVVVGRTTFGKGLVQNTVDLSYNSKLKLTIAKYYIPSGRCIQKLDYSNRDEFGVVNEVPDSLLKKFKTKGGRTVMDGRGIHPDIEVEDEESGRILAGLFAKGLVFKFANKYVQQHPEIASPEAFSLNDADYAAFTEMVKAANITYSTQSSKFLEKLETVAKREMYYEDSNEEFKALSEKLAPNVDRDLRKFKHQISMVLSNEIISRYYYQEGRIRHALVDDPFLDLGITYLNTTKQQKVLQPNG